MKKSAQRTQHLHAVAIAVPPSSMHVEPADSAAAVAALNLLNMKQVDSQDHHSGGQW